MMPLDQTELNSPPVDPVYLDAINYAGAVGASAAGRLFALLTNPDKEFDYRWFTADGGLALDDVENTVDLLADHVCIKRETNAETLYRHAAYEGLCTHEAADWFAESQPRRLAWTLFQSTCLAVFDVIDGQQRRIKDERARAKAAAATAPLALEDSIFEPHGSLGEMLPHAVEALEAGAARQAREDADAVAASIDADSEGHAPMSAAAPLEDETITGPASDAAGVAIGGEAAGELSATLSDAGSMAGGAADAQADTAADTSDGSTQTRPEPAKSKKHGKSN